MKKQGAERNSFISALSKMNFTEDFLKSNVKSEDIIKSIPS